MRQCKHISHPQEKPQSTFIIRGRNGVEMCTLHWKRCLPNLDHICLYPIGSMYGISAYIYYKHRPNVGKYTRPMDHEPWLVDAFCLGKTVPIFMVQTQTQTPDPTRRSFHLHVFLKRENASVAILVSIHSVKFIKPTI